MGRTRAGARVGLLALALSACGHSGVAHRALLVDGKHVDIPRGDAPRLDWPVHAPVTSLFGRRDGRPHEGIDLSVGDGTPVHAAAEGAVLYAGHQLRGYGNLVVVGHAGKLVTVYAHNSRLLVGEGQRVARGEVISLSGHSGRATAPHLHFEVREGDVPRDPLGYLPSTQHQARTPLARR